MAKILAGIAMAAGTAVGVGAVLMGDRRTPRRAPARPDVLDLEPILDRIDRFEARLDAVESANPSEIVADLDRRVRETETEIHRLRTGAGEVERRFHQFTDEIPALVESSVNARVTQLHATLESEMELRHQRSLATIEEKIDKAVEARISEIEKTLAVQSTSISALRERAEVVDTNIQRLIVAVERLCERVPAPPVDAEQPFHSHLEQAIQRPAPDFRPRFVTDADAEAEAKKPRVPLARIFGVLLAFGLSLRMWR